MTNYLPLAGVWKYFQELDMFEVSTHGLKHVKKIKIEDGIIRLKLKEGQPYILQPVSKKE